MVISVAERLCNHPMSRPRSDLDSALMRGVPRPSPSRPAGTAFGWRDAARYNSLEAACTSSQPSIPDRASLLFELMRPELRWGMATMFNDVDTDRQTSRRHRSRRRGYDVMGRS